jgi:hypothetical protein
LKHRLREYHHPYYPELSTAILRYQGQELLPQVDVVAAQAWMASAEVRHQAY